MCEYCILLCVLLSYTYINTVFNVGEYRRLNCGASKSHEFYHPQNEEANRQRR